MSPSLSAVSLTALVAAAQGVRGAYYPSAKYAALEHLLVDSTGHNANTFYKAVTPCGNYVSENSTKTGRVTSAQWMRVAFHDFATADVAAGTGGLDASIVFEYTRPENSGQAFPDSFNYWKYYVGAQTSFSDIIALGTVAAISSCGGPQLVYSAGRIDATAAGQFGVPEPDEGLTDTLARFAGAGISQTDAIKLTACGHTVGSVHHAGFPLVVGTDAVNANNTQGGINMDTTGTTYDNRIAQEYVAGTTKNPLVTSFNVSQRSDLRLFSSDNNATMSTLAESSSLFASECKRLTTQMLNTVPSGVSLTEITPIAVKPVNVTLTVNSAGTVTFSGAIRLLGTQFSANSGRKVTITYTTADGKSTVTVPATTSSSLVGSSTYLGGAATYYYAFSASVKGSSGIKSFVVKTQESSKAAVRTSGPFTFQDTVAFLPGSTSGKANTSALTISGTLSAAVRTDRKVKSVEAVITVPQPRDDGVPKPALATYTVPLSYVRTLGRSSFALYQASGSTSLPSSLNYTLAAPLAAGASFDIVATLNDGSTVKDEYRTIQEASFTIV